MQKLTKTNIIIALLTTGLIGCGDLNGFSLGDSSEDPPVVGLDEPLLNKSMKAFHSCSELDDYLRTNERKKNIETKRYNNWLNTQLISEVESINDSVPTTSVDAADSTSESQITNNQVKGVDEPDIVKVTSDYIFVARKQSVEVLRRSSLKLVKSIDLEGLNNIKLLATNNSLIVMGHASVTSPPNPTPLNVDPFIGSSMVYEATFNTHFFSITENSVDLSYSKSFVGTIVGARLNNGRLILITKKYLNVNYNNGIHLATSIEPERLSVHGIPCTSIIPPAIDDFDYAFTSVHSINVESPQADANSLALLGGNDIIYVTKNSLYLLKNKYRWLSWDNRPAIQAFRNSTIIRKIDYSASNGEINYTGIGSVLGKVKDQFSVSELDDGKFISIVTTTTPVSTGFMGTTTSLVDPGPSVSVSMAPAVRSNHLHVLQVDRDYRVMAIVGAVRGLAPTEDVKSVRYVGSMAYIVTFRQTDPLFAIDLSNPNSPNLLSELKIPGFSSYMHPLGDDLLVGVGSAATDTGRLLGVQVSLFDISDPTNVTALDQEPFGERGSVTEVSRDHHAFYIDQERKRIAVPMNLIGYGSTPVFQGAYLFDLTTDKILIEARLSHRDLMSKNCQEYANQRRYDSLDILRVFELDGSLISVSKMGIKANDIEQLNIELKSVQFNDNEDQCI